MIIMTNRRVQSGIGETATGKRQKYKGKKDLVLSLEELMLFTPGALSQS